jgi:hypothetical protein
VPSGLIYVIPEQPRPCCNIKMQNLDHLLTLADECYAAARASSNPLMRAQLKVMGDDYLKQAEELQKNGVVVHVPFPKSKQTH